MGVRNVKKLQWSTGTAGDLTRGAMTGTTTITAKFNVGEARGVGLQFRWTGTPTGTLSFQVSNSFDDDSNQYTEIFSTLDATLYTPAIVNPAGAAGDKYYDLRDVDAEWLQITYVNSTGTGELECYAKSKAPAR